MKVLKPWQKFIIVGAITTLLTYLFYLFLKHFISYNKAYFIAYFSGILISYSLNGKMVFESKFSIQTFLIYPLVYLAQYSLSAFLLKTLIQYEFVNDTLAPLFVTATMIPLTFLMTRFVFFNIKFKLTKT